MLKRFQKNNRIDPTVAMYSVKAKILLDLKRQSIKKLLFYYWKLYFYNLIILPEYANGSYFILQ